MTDDPKKLKVVVPPEVLQELEQTMTAQEIQQLLDEFKKSVEDGSLFEKSQPVDLDKLAEEDPELYHIIVERLSKDPDDNEPTLH